MIEITYDFKGTELFVKGHANSAPMGEDLVCATVSGLTVALACTLKDAKRQEMLDDLTIDLEDGNAHIKAVPKKGFERDVMIMFSTVFNGYDALSISFKDYVSFKPRVGIRESTN